MRKYPAFVIISLAYVFGGGSLLMFGTFCYAGPLHLIKLGLTQSKKLLLDSFLSLAFFLQHSGMVRKSFRNYLARFVPETYVSALYAFTSGIVLIAVVVLWQETSGTVVKVGGVPRLLLRAAFVASIAGFIWGIKALGYFDPFGIRTIVSHLHGKKPKVIPLTIRGPYRWVRHPLYLFVLVMIWSHPYLTWDRLLFNILWTVWIYIGAILEERDLVEDFGDAYRRYQKKVPMIVPPRISPSWPGDAD
jgi:protein-S-isoprenylcysteine O-methyltransferase Ste14